LLGHDISASEKKLDFKGRKISLIKRVRLWEARVNCQARTLTRRAGTVNIDSQ